MLTNLPTGAKAYDYAYETTLQRITHSNDSDSKELALSVLQWITCAKRPLTKEELQHALAVEVGTTELDEENLVQIEEMVSVCAGLVTIDEESNIIRLVHYTTREYFERTQAKWFPAAQAQITTVCVTYLSFSAFETGVCETKQEFEERLQSFPFYNYAASNWGHHAPKDEASQQVIEFLKSKAKVEASGQALMDIKRGSSENNYSHDIPEKMTGLHLAGLFGVNKATGTLLELGYSPHVEDTWNRSPLWYASQNGHGAIVELLSAVGADINVVDIHKQTALQVAVENGHREIVEKLLAAGANVNVTSGSHYRETALSAVAENGHQEIVEMLLAAGADVNTSAGSDFHRWSALSTAARWGHQGVVEKLLAVGADIEARIGVRGHEHTALDVAAENGHQEIFEILLAAGAKVENTALQAAAGNGHQEIVEKLLAAGANVTILMMMERLHFIQQLRGDIKKLLRSS